MLRFYHCFTDIVFLLYLLADGVVTDAVTLNNKRAVLHVLLHGRGGLFGLVGQVGRGLVLQYNADTGMNRLNHSVAAVEVGAESTNLVGRIGPVKGVVLPEEEESAALTNLQCGRVYGAEELRVAYIRA